MGLRTATEWAVRTVRDARAGPGDQAGFADAPCSPIFTQAYDAVRYAQRLSSPQAQVQFGYVLKSVKRNAYMTTVPLMRADYSDFKQVFVEGSCLRVMP